MGKIDRPNQKKQKIKKKKLKQNTPVPS